MIRLPLSDDELYEIVVKQLELIADGDFQESRRVAERWKLPLSTVLVQRNRVPPRFLMEQVAQAWNVGFLDLSVVDIDPAVLPMIGAQLARTKAMMPVRLEGNELVVAMYDPRNEAAIKDASLAAQRRARPVLAPERAIRRAQLLYVPAIREMMLSVKAGRGHTKIAQGEAADIVQQILQYGVMSGASDIHIEALPIEGLVRYRVDGTLHDLLTVDAATWPRVTARLKVLSGMRVDEKRAPQDGRIEANIDGFDVDVRASSIPAHWGEKFVLRLLAKDSFGLDLKDVGMQPSDYAIIQAHISRPHGMILVTGPTGSGKSTTLYALLAGLGNERLGALNVSTVEDPVEYTLPRLNQMSINPAAGLTFADGLRALLRQDPDVLMVGEIRDRETAEIACRAAMVGRLLLSTLHTNDATSAVTRMVDMGVEPFLIASTLSLVTAQRLIRRICTRCRVSAEAPADVIAAIRQRPDHDLLIDRLRREGVVGKDRDPFASLRTYHGTGCVHCRGTGFNGRIGIFEMFEVDDTVRRQIMANQDAALIREHAVQSGMKTLFQDGMVKVMMGETTYPEVIRVAT